MSDAPMQQGSPEWLEYRRTRGGASEVAALLGCSPWYPRTPADLFDLKTGATTKYVTAAMNRGNELEAVARALVEHDIGEEFCPGVVAYSENPRIIASLDGITLDGDRILEIKVPAKGRESELWAYVNKHLRPPEYYWWQVQQQLLCSGADYALFVVYSHEPQGLATVVVAHDADAHKRIIEVWTEFFAALDSGQRPACDDEPVTRDDAEWLAAAQAWQAAKQALDAATAAEKDARKALLELAGDQSAVGGGIKVIRHWVSGGIDYKAAVPDGVDLSQYEKPGRWQYRLTGGGK